MMEKVKVFKPIISEHRSEIFSDCTNGENKKVKTFKQKQDENIDKILSKPYKNTQLLYVGRIDKNDNKIEYNQKMYEKLNETSPRKVAVFISLLNAIASSWLIRLQLRSKKTWP